MDPKHRSIVRRTSVPASASEPLVTPLSPAAVHRFRDADQLDAHYEGAEAGYIYAREGHLNAAVLADKIDWLEGAEGGIVTSSGMGAVSAVLLGLLQAGDHVVAGNQLYGRSHRLLSHELPRLGIRATLVDAADAAAVAAAIEPATRLLLAEVVSNPTLRLADVPALARLAAEYDLVLAIDNTFTTPRAFQPLAHGADVVIHSITKLLGGHSDLTLGYAAARDADHRTRICDAMVTWGLNPSPFDCWLAERGLHTFDLRYDRAQANAGALADFLRARPNVAHVIYPGAPDHPDHALASSLLGGNAGTIVSFELSGGRAAVNAFLRAAEHLPFAPTLGDVATLISHPASSSHRSLGPAGRAALGIGDGLLRVSLGIEDIALLCAEFGTALAAAA